ncbi:DUF3857 domain-containing protein [Sphingomonas azotifigens]|uniref:DUF3857 domain-containing protein n=1 Tax=Sphingomonas azotifigens TaxID=330920 RepID=UPI000A00DBD4|nr:DUF3857 domain-containing protein [Sphingomonas azotifigens]
MSRVAFMGLLLSTVAAVAHAGDKPLVQPVPDWVKLAPVPDTRALTDDSPLMLVSDVQARLGDGGSWTYVERATRLATIQSVSQAGTIKIDWQPAHGDLIVHGVDILRDGQRIDALKGHAFTVIQREAGLEKMMLDGQLTATLAVEGLRPGDVLDLRYSLTNKDPALAGNSSAGGPILSEPIKIGFARTRFLWPSSAKVGWKAYPVGAVPKEADSGGWHELVFAQPLPRQPDAAPGAPGRFARPPFVEASTFADWASVSRVFAPLYRTEGLIPAGSPLAAEVAKIAAAEKDPRRRVAAALALVQGKVRYLYRGMENGNLVPQAPAQTLALGYGDCKAKTLLLLALLHALGISAEPALANLGAGDLVSARLPSAAAFNHIFVLAKLGDETLWLDGTATGTRLEDLGDVLPFHWVLPLRAEGASLLAVPDRAPARFNTIATLDQDLRGGINIPAPFDAEVTLRGGTAVAMRSLLGMLPKQDQRILLQRFLPGGMAETMLTDANVRFDDSVGTATITLRGIATQRWGYGDLRYRTQLPIGHLPDLPDRSRAIWKDVPVDTGEPSRTRTTIRLRLPEGGKDMALDGATAFDQPLPGGRRLSGKASLAGDLLTLDTEQAQTGGEIAAADLPAARMALAEFRNRRISVRTAPRYPAPWHGVDATKRAHRYDEVLARYASFIAERPEEAARYVARGYFLTLIFERQKALADFDKAIALDAKPDTLFRRAAVREALGDRAGAIQDLQAAQAAAPGNTPVLARLTMLLAEDGRKDEALALLDPRIAEGGENLPDMLSAKATALARAGDKDGALATIDRAIADKPGNGRLLNNRCWLQGTLNLQLEAALKDCTRAIELSDQIAATALDSRALVYFRQNRLDEAMADLNAALEQRPTASGTLFLRGVVEARQGKKREAGADLADARLLDPQVDANYARYGIKP